MVIVKLLILLSEQTVTDVVMNSWMVTLKLLIMLNRTNRNQHCHEFLDGNIKTSNNA